MLYFKKHSLMFKVFCVLCCIVLFLSPVNIISFADEVETDTLEPAPTASECVAENEKCALYVDFETGNFSLLNKANGQYWYNKPTDVENDSYTVGTTYTNVQSTIVIGYVDRATEPSANELSYANDYVYCPPEQMEITKIKNGIKIVYNFEEFGFSIPVNYTIEDSYLEASIDVKNIKEGKKCYIVTINLLPVFGAGNWETEGELFIPDGSGAIVKFNNGVQTTSPYVAKIYGEDLSFPKKTLINKTQPIYMPVFATLKNEGSLFGIITEGDADASVTYINGNARCGYNAVSSIFNYRTKDVITMFSGTGSSNNINRVSRVHSEAKKYSVRYYATNKSNYPDLAEIYRNYLIDNKKMKQTASSVSFNLDIYGGVETKASFLGIPYNKKLALTSYSQAEEMIKELKSAGINELSARYVGWNNNGILNKKVNNSLEPAGYLGGKKNLSKLIDFCNTENVSIYLDNDIIKFRKNGNGVKTSKDAVNTIFSEETVLYSYMRSVYATVLSQEDVYMVSSSKITDVFNKYLKSLKKQQPNLKTIGLSTTGNMLYSNPQSKKGNLCTDLLNKYTNIYSSLAKDGYSLILESANAYAFPYAEKLLSVPTASSGYDSFDVDVPFYSMVLHGYKDMSVNPIMQSDNPQKSFLNAIEMGIGIAYAGIYENSSLLTNTMYDNLYSSSYTLWKEKAVEQYSQYDSIYKKIYNLPITEHTAISKDVVKTVFGNKYAVFVNYGDTDITVEDVNIKSEGFTVKEML